MKLWQKNTNVNERIDAFTVGRDRELDLELAPFDILGSLAHIRMLASVGLLEKEEERQLRAALQRLHQETTNGRFTIDPGMEDVHSQVEFLLTRELGVMGKKIHSGRSRNDQVLVDLRLYFRDQLKKVVSGMEALFAQLQSLSEEHKDVLLPGYTHLQIAMPSSFGLWFGAYAENLTDDLTQMLSTYLIINQNPLGSAAGYGSSFPLDRKMTTRLLGFADLNYNVVHAQMGRGKTELFIGFALAGLAQTLNKLATDMVMYLNQNFGFIRFPDELTTGSSIMPHKKNPDVFELIRAKANQLLALPAQIGTLTTNLPSGYHRDFQLLKEYLFPAFDQTQQCLEMMTFALRHIEVKPNILDDEKYQYLFSVEAVNKEVLNGTPFRDAYRLIGEQIESGRFNPPKQVEHTHEGSIGNLCTREIRMKMDRILRQFDFDKVTEAERQLLEKTADG